MGTTINEEAAVSLAESLAALGVPCDVNGDSAGYEVFVALPDRFTLCATATPEASGYDWQILDGDSQQALAGTWSPATAGEAAEQAQSLVRGLGAHLTR